MDATHNTGEMPNKKGRTVIYRISGHESFPCRYAWLPKAVQHLMRDPRLFANEEQAMVALGVGKNMVRSIRFWSQAAGVMMTVKRDGHALSPFGSLVFGENGFDPFLEDIRTLWLIHWNLSTDVQNPLLAWDYLLNRWQEPDFTPSKITRALQKEATKNDDGLSLATLEQHVDTFLHTYVPTRGRKGEVQEDNLDCPLIELELILRVGERHVDKQSGRAESIYSFRREEKPDITQELFTYALNDFWNKRHGLENTLSFREVAHGHGSPGQIFKLPEDDIRHRTELLAQYTKSFFSYAESASLQQLSRKGRRESIELLDDIYRREGKVWLKSAL